MTDPLEPTLSSKVPSDTSSEEAFKSSTIDDISAGDKSSVTQIHKKIEQNKKVRDGK